MNNKHSFVEPAFKDKEIAEKNLLMLMNFGYKSSGVKQGMNEDGEYWYFEAYKEYV